MNDTAMKSGLPFFCRFKSPARSYGQSSPHRLHVAQCLLLDGRSKRQVLQRFSGHTRPSHGYKRLWASTFEGVMVPGSERQAAANATKQMATESKPVSLRKWKRGGAVGVEQGGGRSEADARVEHSHVPARNPRIGNQNE